MTIVALPRLFGLLAATAVAFGDGRSFGAVDAGC